MNIDEMAAGRELDALVAEKVMGCKVCLGFVMGTGQILHGSEKEPHCTCDSRQHYSDARGEVDRFSNIPDYSTDIAAAWEVAEKVYAIFEAESERDQSRNSVTVERSNSNGLGKFWRCQIGSMISSIALTAPLAICRAALKAVGA